MVLYRIPLIYLGVTSECPLKSLKHPLSAERPLETSNTTAGQSPRKQYSDDGSCQVTSSSLDPQEVTPHSSAAVPQEVTPHSSAAVPQEVTPHSSAAVPQEVIPHSSAVVPDPVLDTNENFNTEAVTQERVASFISSPIFHDFLHDQCDVRRIATKLHSLGAISRDELDNMGPLRKANSGLYLSLAKDSNVIRLQLVSKALQFDALHENHQMLAKRINKFVKGMYIFQK